LGRSNSLEEPQGIKVSDKMLAEALKRSGLRGEMPYRTTRQDCANAVESLLVYGYLNKIVTIDEAVERIAAASESPIEGLIQLIKTVASSIESRKPSNA
jgi:hypothetical protein